MLYVLLSDYQNFFQSMMRLKTKVRDGARVTRKYDKALTAYQRVLKRKDIAAETKQRLRERYKKLNPNSTTPTSGGFYRDLRRTYTSEPTATRRVE